MKRAEILDTAKQYVTADRNASYGDPEDSFALIAEFWNAYLGAVEDRNLHKSDDCDIGDRNIDAFDVANMMALMKIARLSQKPKNVDSAIDLAGYAACGGEILEKSR